MHVLYIIQFTYLHKFTCHVSSTNLDKCERPVRVWPTRHGEACAAEHARDLDRQVRRLAEHHLDVDGQLEAAAVDEVKVKRQLLQGDKQVKVDQLFPVVRKCTP